MTMLAIALLLLAVVLGILFQRLSYRENVLISLDAFFQNIFHGHSNMQRTETQVTTQEPLEQRAQREPSYFPDIVDSVPKGFIALEEAINGMGGVLTTLFWSTNFVVHDSENVTIFQTGVKNSSFIVIFCNAYYVDKERISEIARYAADISDQRNKIYNIGDVIEIRGSGGADSESPMGTENLPTYSLEIINVERTASKGTAVYEIKFILEPVVDEAIVLGFFDHVLTRCIRRRRNFTLIDQGTIRIELGRFEHIGILALNAPEEIRISDSQDSIRHVTINKK